MILFYFPLSIYRYALRTVKFRVLRRSVSRNARFLFTEASEQFSLIMQQHSYRCVIYTRYSHVTYYIIQRKRNDGGRVLERFRMGGHAKVVSCSQSVIVPSKKRSYRVWVRLKNSLLLIDTAFGLPCPLCRLYFEVSLYWVFEPYVLFSLLRGPLSLPPPNLGPTIPSSAPAERLSFSFCLLPSTLLLKTRLATDFPTKE